MITEQDKRELEEDHEFASATVDPRCIGSDQLVVRCCYCRQFLSPTSGGWFNPGDVAAEWILTNCKVSHGACHPCAAEERRKFKEGKP